MHVKVPTPIPVQAQPPLQAPELNRTFYQNIPRPIVLTGSSVVVELSHISQFTAELKSAVNTQGIYGEVRSDVIEKIRTEMASGHFGGGSDLEHAVNALLRVL